MIPSVPIASALFPIMAPVVTPTWWHIRLPTSEIHRGLAVVTNRYAQDEYWHVLWLYKPPRPIVPRALVPVIILINPVQTIIEEKVCAQLWRVVNGVTWHDNEFRVYRKVNPDAYVGQPNAYANLNGSRSCRIHEHT